MEQFSQIAWYILYRVTIEVNNYCCELKKIIYKVSYLFSGIARPIKLILSQPFFFFCSSKLKKSEKLFKGPLFLVRRRNFFRKQSWNRRQNTNAVADCPCVGLAPTRLTLRVPRIDITRSFSALPHNSLLHDSDYVRDFSDSTPNG